MGKILYDTPVYFLLRYGTEERVINEPVNWDKVQASFPRDKDYHGFNAEFIGDKSELIFTYNDNGGGEWVYEIWNTIGSDALMEFEFGYLQSAYRNKLFSGFINFNEPSTVDSSKGNGISVTVERKSFEDTLRAKFDTKITVNQPYTLGATSVDLVPLTPIPEYNLKLHSKEIIKRAYGGNPTMAGDYLNQTSSSDPWNGDIDYIQPNTEEITITELKDMQEMPAGIIRHSTPQLGQFYQFYAVEAGRLEITFTGSVDDIGGFAPNEQPGDNFLHIIALFFGQEGSNTATVFIPITSYISDMAFNGTGAFTWSQMVTLNVEPGDRCYVGLGVNHVYPSSPVIQSPVLSVDNMITHIDFKGYTIRPASMCKAYKVSDVINQCIEAITGKQNRLASSILTNGSLKNYHITNGFNIRRFTNRPVQVSLKTLIEGIQAIFNTGAAYQNISGDDYFSVEFMADFYRDMPIVEIKELFEYSEFNNTENTHSNIHIGYNKYALDEFNSLDEFNTEHEYTTPITTFENTFTKKADVITSGYLSEIVRREQYEINPSTSLENDDDIFLFSTRAQNVYREIEWTISSGTQIAFDKPVGMVVGDSFTLSGGGTANSSIDFVVTDRVYGTGNDTYAITPSATSEIITGILSIYPPSGTNVIVAERNEDFSVVNNVLNPAGSYNIRLNPKYILYNWAPYFNIGTFWKSDNEYIRNTLVKANQIAAFQYEPFAAWQFYVPTFLTDMNDQVQLLEYSRDSIVYTPVGQMFKTVMRYETFLTLRASLTGSATDPAYNYGCLIVPDDRGQRWYSAIMDLKYEFNTGTASIICQKKRKV